MTNFEKIKQMSIDEMAQSDIVLPECVGPEGFGDVPIEYCDKFGGNCVDCKKHWLESEADTD